MGSDGGGACYFRSPLRPFSRRPLAHARTHNSREKIMPSPSPPTFVQKCHFLPIAKIARPPQPPQLRKKGRKFSSEPTLFCPHPPPAYNGGSATFFPPAFFANLDRVIERLEKVGGPRLHPASANRKHVRKGPKIRSELACMDWGRRGPHAKSSPFIQPRPPPTKKSRLTSSVHPSDHRPAGRPPGFYDNLYWPFSRLGDPTTRPGGGREGNCKCH